MVGYLESFGLAGATVLEVGGGVGELHVELLKRGAERAVNLELSPAYDEEARRLLAESALEGRVERRLHDIAVEPDAVEPVDVVVLNRVVCCYPDYERLLGAAATHARRALVFSYPRRNAISRAIVGVQNRGSGSRARSSACSPTRRRRWSGCCASRVSRRVFRWRDGVADCRARANVNGGWVGERFGCRGGQVGRFVGVIGPKSVPLARRDALLPLWG